MNDRAWSKLAAPKYAPQTTNLFLKPSDSQFSFEYERFHMKLNSRRNMHVRGP